MSRSTLILIIVLLVLAIGGVGAFLYFKAGGTNTNTNTTNTTANTNTTVSTNIGGANVVAEVLSENQLDERVTFRGADIPVDRVEVTNAYTGYREAPAGKKYVVVYLEDEALAHEEPMYLWISTDIQLSDSEGRTYRYNNAQIGGVEEGATQFISFLVEEDASGFSLRFVRDGEDESLDLGL